MTRTEEVSDEMLMALADGELPEAEARALRARIATDPAMADRFAIFAETRALLQDTFPPEPVPEHLIAAVMAQDGVTRSSVVPFAPRKGIAMPGWGMALAASLVLAVGTAGFLTGRAAGPDMLASGPQAAAEALAMVPTGQDVTLADGTVARAVGSYQTDVGLCRLIDTGASRVLACQAPDGWAVALTVTSAGDGSYLPASDLGTEVIDQMLDGLAASAPLDAEAEAQALRQ